MSLLNVNHPIADAGIYELSDSLTYISENYSALIVIKGNIFFDEMNTPAGEFILLPPNTPLLVSPGPKSAIGCVRFSNFFLLSVLDNADWFHKTYSSSEFLVMSGWSAIIENIILLFHNNTNAAMATSFFSLIDRMNSYLPEKKYEFPTELNEKGKEILSYINQNITTPLTLNETAENVGLTPQYLSSFFQKYIGLTFKEYINQRKIDLCIPFLEYTQMTDSAISSAIGFASEISMQKAFLNLTQKSTSEFRKASPVKAQIFPEISRVNNFSDYITQRNDTPLENSHDTSNVIHQQAYVDSLKKPVHLVPDSWRKILNIGEAQHFIDPFFREQLIHMQTGTSFIYGRVLDLLDSTTIHEINGQIFYGFERIFTILDLLIDLKLIPFIVIGNRYKKNASHTNDLTALSSSEDYQNYYKKLSKILPPFIRSCCNRYGVSEVARWQFEICYESSSHGNNRQTIWNFCNTFRKIEATLHEYCPGCCVGGTGFPSLHSAREFETMLKTLSSENIRVDFISFYAVSIEEVNGQLRLPKSGNTILEQASKLMHLAKQYYPDLPVYITEFNICNNRHSYLNDYVFNACFILWFIIANLNLVDGMGYSRLSDIGESSANTNMLLYGGSGLYNMHGIRKPSFYSFRFLKELGPVMSFYSKGVLITTKNPSSIQALMFHCPGLTDEACINYKNEKLLFSDSYTFEAVSSKNIETVIKDVSPGNYLIKEYRINRKSGNILREYSHVHGIKDLTTSDIDCFQYLSNPSAKLSQATVGADETLTLHTMVHPLEIVMLQIDFNNKGDRNEI